MCFCFVLLCFSIYFWDLPPVFSVLVLWVSEWVSEVAQSCPTLCDPMDGSPLGSSPMGFSKQEYWGGLPFPSPGDLPDSGIELGSPAFQADALTSEPPGKPTEQILTHSKPNQIIWIIWWQNKTWLKWTLRKDLTKFMISKLLLKRLHPIIVLVCDPEILKICLHAFQAYS